MPPGKPSKKEAERRYDKTVEDSFPASDPPAHSGIVGPQSDDGTPSREPPHQRADDTEH